MQIDDGDREFVRAETEALVAAVRDPEVRAVYGELLAAVDAGAVPEPLQGALERVLELGLRSGRVGRLHGPHAEAALRRLYQRTPRGAELARGAREVSRALAGLKGQALAELSFAPRGPGAYTLTVETDRCRLTLDIGEDGIAVKDLGVGL